MGGENCDVFDGLEVAGASVERDTGGLPVAWRLLRVPANELVKAGRRMVLHLSQEDVQAIAKYQSEKGEKIPIDSRHALFLAASKAGVEEDELRKLIPQNTGALGYGNLEARPDGLWVKDVEWLPLARQVVADGMFRYFSPVVRGLKEGPLRVTSVAMDNVPALSGLDALAAEGEGAHMGSIEGKQQTKEARMERVEKALGELLGIESLVLSEEHDLDIAGKIEALAQNLKALKEECATMEALKAEKGELTAKISELELAAETARKEALIEDAARDGKITNAQKPALRKLDEAALGEFIAAAPKTVPLGKGVEPKPKDEDEAALTREEKELASWLGINPDELAATKKKMKKEGI